MQNWELIQAYFRDKNFAQMEIDSFDQFVEKKLPEIVEENSEIIPKIEEVKIELSDIEVEKPKIVEADGSPRSEFYPMEARTRNRTYSGPLSLTMRMLRRDVEQDIRRAYIGELPIMVKSKLCWLKGKSEEELVEMGEDPKDPGGYFVINGSEKALMTQEVLASDRVLITEGLKGIDAEVISTKGAFKGRVRVSRKSDGLIYITFPSSPKKLKLFVLLKALGLKTLREFKDAFPSEKEIENDILVNWQNTFVKTEEEALDRLGKFVAPGQVIDYRLRRAQEVIDAFLLPHIGQRKEDRLAKAYYLTMMATKGIERYYGLRGEDDKDHYANKRLELSGKLMEHLFRYSFKYFIKDLKFQIDRTVTRRRKLNISTVVRPGAVSERIKFAMSTGNWIGRSTGVSKFMDRVNYLSPLTDLRKVKSPLNKNRELYEARDVHGTHWGRLGPVETPDGPQCVAPESEIILSTGEKIKIGEIENIWGKHKVASIDWENKKEAEAHNARYLKMKPKKKVVKVKAKESGRTLIATVDHPFYSEEKGKTELANLKIGDMVAVMPSDPVEFEEPLGKTLLSEGDVINACPEKSDKKYLLKELEGRGLLPLKDSDERMQPLVRLLGHLFGDGCLTLSMKKYKSACALVFSGEEKDLEEIRKDVEEIGFSASKQSVYKKESMLDNGRLISGYSRRMDCYSKPLWVLMAALGAPIGDKTVKAVSAPRWLKGQRKILVKEFLAAYFGSEMTKPSVDKRNGKIFLQPVFSLNKETGLVKNGVQFVEEIKELLEEFGIRMASTSIVYGTKRKNGLETRKIKAKLSADLQNLLRLYGKIGFGYCAERKSLARMAYSYLLNKRVMIEKRVMAFEQVISMHRNGKSNSFIAEKLCNEVRKHDVCNWVKKYEKGKKSGIRVSEKDFQKFNEWIREHAISENGMVWETIESLEEVECNDVRDITTFEHYHNFFANGFLTGNCGLVKNLALMAEVTTEAEEAPIEELLHNKGVKMRKL